MFSAAADLFTWSALYTELGYKYANFHRFPHLMLLDSLIGLALVALMARCCANFSAFFWPALYLSIEQLEKLITWLTNNPGGLKLNDALNTFLSNFFFYHIHLWRTYVSVLEQHSWTNSWALFGAGAVGASVFVAFLADFLRLLTIHMFCFHVYTHSRETAHFSLF